ncbi:MAG TPA: dihydrodipicolinate synthase family protein [Terracidiphilus sp.]|nr:dihydrodipicolinate synthase family protein [Terracidiphilus sp.]
MQLNGVIAPVCTPFEGNGEVHFDALRQNIAKYIDAGLKKFVVAGSTGEAPLLSGTEKRQLFQCVREAADGCVLIAGTGAESVKETLALVHQATAFDYKAGLVLTPHFYRSQMSRPGTQAEFFRSVADSSPIPILIYNFPQMTGIDLLPETIMQLSEHPNIVGVKESSPDLDRIRKLTSSLPVGFNVIVGASPKFHESLCLGVNGGIVAIANAAPRSTLQVYDRYQLGDVAGSRTAQNKLTDAAGVAARYGIQGLKYAMDLMGYFGGPSRLPLLPLNDEQKAEIELLFSNVRQEE